VYNLSKRKLFPREMSLPLAAGVLLLLLIGSGCQSQRPAALPVPPAIVNVTHFAGTALSGPTATAPPKTSAADALTVRVTFIALEKSPDRRFDALASRARLISSTTGGSPLLSSARLTRDVQVITLQTSADAAAKLTAASAGRKSEITALTAALPPGVTAEFTVRDPQLLQDSLSGVEKQRRVRIEVSRSAQANEPLQLALALDAPTGASSASSQGERAIIDLAATDPHCLAMTIPFQFHDAQSRALAAVIEVSPGADDEAHQQALARCDADVRRSISSLSNQPNLLPADAERWSSLQAAIASLDIPTARRTALVFLAGRTSAHACEDVALVADEATLAKLAQQVRSSVTAVTTPQTDAAIGWTLDHAAFDFLAQLLADASASGAAPMPDELAATLAAHAGEAGRHPSSMQQVLRQVGGREDLDNRLLAENFIFLEDSSPASRVRAFDWLTAHGRAPAGYDPLGTPRQRRQALEHGLSAAAAGGAP